MCILFTFINPNPQQGGFKVIIASNRDEMYARPAKPAQEWENHHGVYGGKAVLALLFRKLPNCYIQL